MAKKKQFDPSDFRFEADGKVYEVIVPKFKLRLGDGQHTIMTAAEAVENEEALATLVDIKSGVIREVVAKAEAKAKDPSVKELKAMLEEAGVEFDPKAKKDELLALVESIKTE